MKLFEAIDQLATRLERDSLLHVRRTHEVEGEEIGFQLRLAASTSLLARQLREILKSCADDLEERYLESERRREELTAKCDRIEAVLRQQGLLP